MVPVETLRVFGKHLQFAATRGISWPLVHTAGELSWKLWPQWTMNSSLVWRKKPQKDSACPTIWPVRLHGGFVFLGNVMALDDKKFYQSGETATKRLSVQLCEPFRLHSGSIFNGTVVALGDKTCYQFCSIFTLSGVPCVAADDQRFITLLKQPSKGSLSSNHTN